MFMKILYVFILFLVSHKVSAQTQSEKVAQVIAGKMKDSLNLTEKEAEIIYKLNLTINDQKNTMRQRYSGRDSLTKKIQRIENTRDSLYRPVLSGDQYVKYKQRKTSLISSN
jgi:hypothetical protein